VRELTRREALSGATGLGAVAIAGCVSNNDDPDAANSDPDSENGQDNGNDTDAANSDPDSESENGQDNGAESQDNSDDQGTELELTGRLSRPATARVARVTRSRPRSQTVISRSAASCRRRTSVTRQS
jgi:hypothetical protein